MRKSILVAALIAAAVAASATAQTSDVMAGKAPGMAGVARTTNVTATITAIDKASRTITLKGPQGNEISVVAGPDVKNFDQLAVGDNVDVGYIEALAIQLKKGGTAPVARTESGGAAAAKPGEAPGAVVGRQTTVVADVIGVDAATQTVTLRGPQRTLDVKVSDPEQFKMIEKGDQVEATYTEAAAVSVSKK